MTPSIIRGCVGALVLMVLPFATFALECDFERECFEAEACTDSNFSASFVTDVQTGHGQLISDSQTIEGDVSVAESGATYFFAPTGSALHLLTIGTDRTARYTVHMTKGPLVATYLGKCEAT
jgi:hypothetical protein